MDNGARVGGDAIMRGGVERMRWRARARRVVADGGLAVGMVVVVRHGEERVSGNLLILTSCVRHLPASISATLRYKVWIIVRPSQHQSLRDGQGG